MDSLSLVVGDRVVYPNQGLCKVTAIEAKEVAGQKLKFVTLVREEDGAKVMVPEGKVLAIGVRKVSGAEDVTKVFAFLKSDSDKASLDWKARARTNVERMSTGGLIGLAEVVKGLQVLSELRPLPPKERELYNDARHLLVTELAAALKIPACDAEDALDIVLFPVGKERPKRSADEFKADDDLLGEEGDLLGFEGEPAEEEPEEKAEGDGEAEEKAEGEAEGDGEEKPKKRGRPPKAAAAAAPEPEAPKKSLLSDLELTAPTGTPLTEPLKRKRGRPPKPKPPPPENPPPPKKRGRPPKPKPVEAVPPEPKKRGRPPKKK